MTTLTQSKAKQEFEQKLSTVVSFLETLFVPDIELPELASNLIENSTWYKTIDYQTYKSWSRSRSVLLNLLNKSRILVKLLSKA